MNSSSILKTLGALLVLTTAGHADPVSITINSNGGSKYTDAYGNLLADGSVIRIGQFDLSQPGSLSLLQTSNDFLALDALFTPLGESRPFGGTINEAGATGDYIVINSLFSAGDVFGQIIDIDLNRPAGTYFQPNTPLYAWVFNSATPQTATEWGIFSSTTGWGFPTAPGSETLSTFEIDNIVRGCDTGTMLTLSPIPEPGSIALVLVGAGLFALRYRRPKQSKPALA